MRLKKTVLEAEGVNLSFSGVKILHDIHFDLAEGEVHCLLGENGAGKSSFIKILGGIYHADSGKITIDNKEVMIRDVTDSKKLGISIIHQELCLADNLSVAQNVYLGREPVYSGIHMMNDEKMNRDTAELFKRLKIEHIKPQTLISELKTSSRQMVEIAKALSMEARIIIMDEPTSSLTDNEVENLFEFISELKGKGISIIYISHRLEEIFEIGDRVTVFRDGGYITTKEVKSTERDELITLMAGRPVSEFYKADKHNISKEVVLEVKGFSRKNAFQDISFQLHKGEILGLSGLVGAGRTELVRAIFGIDRISCGELFLYGKKTEIKNPSQAIAEGIALVPEDRKEQGLILINTVRFNMTLTILKQYIKRFKINKKVERQIINRLINDLAIKYSGEDTICVNMSGGNQQKVVLGKWLATNPRILILDEPTRGIDVATKAELYRMIQSLADEGIAILMISSELPEIVNLCTRVLVMYEGRITADIKEKEQINQINIMHYAVGGVK